MANQAYERGIAGKKMQLTVTTDYAIRIIMYLAKTKRVASAGEISEKVGIAKKSLLATANKLRSANLITGHMGVSGGYSLLQKPENITILDILKVTEGPLKIMRCQEHGQFCSCFAAQECPTHSFYREVQEKLERQFEETTIQKLIDGSKKDTQ